MTTIIRHVRHPFDSDACDKVETLIGFLATETLDPMFEEYGDFVTGCSSSFLDAIDAEALGLDRKLTLHVWGNFHTLSAVFDILTDDEAVIAPLVAAIRANKATLAYKVARDERRAYQAERKRRADEIERRAIEAYPHRLAQLRLGRD